MKARFTASHPRLPCTIDVHIRED
jgi:hypothetical protein